jgi:hypothetical protein
MPKMANAGSVRLASRVAVGEDGLAPARRSLPQDPSHRTPELHPATPTGIGRRRRALARARDRAEDG